MLPGGSVATPRIAVRDRHTCGSRTPMGPHTAQYRRRGHDSQSHGILERAPSRGRARGAVLPLKAIHTVSQYPAQRGPPAVRALPVHLPDRDPGLWPEEAFRAPPLLNHPTRGDSWSADLPRGGKKFCGRAVRERGGGRELEVSRALERYRAEGAPGALQPRAQAASGPGRWRCRRRSSPRAVLAPHVDDDMRLPGLRRSSLTTPWTVSRSPRRPADEGHRHGGALDEARASRRVIIFDT